MATDAALPLTGHELLRWSQTRLFEALGRGVDHIEHVVGCSCGESGPVGPWDSAAMWFIGHCFAVLGADIGNGWGRTIDDDEAQRLWFDRTATG